MSETIREPDPHTAGNAAAAAALAAQIGPLQKEAAATRIAVEDRLRVLRRIAVWLVAFVAMTTVLVALVLVLLVQNRQTSAKTRAVIRTNAEVSAQIADCTRAGGACYEKQQAQLRQSIELLVASNKAIAQCARSTDNDAAFDACVDAKLASVAPARPR